MDIFSHESKRTKKQFDAFLQERQEIQAQDNAVEQNAPEGQQQKVISDREKSRTLTKRFLGVFTSKHKELKAEARYGDNVASTLYVPRKSAAATEHEKIRLREADQMFGNKVVTVEDNRITREFSSIYNENRKNLDQAFKAIPNQEKRGMKENKLRELSWWMEKDKSAEAKDILRTYILGNDAKKEMLTRFTEEIVSYNFSLAMLNPAWLSANAATFIKMTGKAQALQSLFRDNPDFVNELPKEVRELVDIKIKEADALREALKADLAIRGQELNLDTGQTGIKARNRHQVEIANKESVLAAKNAFKTAKKQEIKKINDLTDEREDSAYTIENLTYMDFVAMTGTKNRGQIALKNGKLSIINNGYFCSKKGSPSAENLMIRQRFMDTALMQLDVNDRETFRPQLMTMLKLYDEGQKESMPLSRITIMQVIREINGFRSQVKRAMNVAEDQKEKAEYKLAARINNLFPAFDGGYPKTKAEKKDVSSKISQILTRAKRIGVNGSSLSEHQMDNIINGNLDLLRDNIFESLKTLDSMILNLKGGDDHNIDAILTNEDLITKIAALEIRRMVQSTDQVPPVAEHMLGQFLEEKAFELSGKAQLKASFDSLYVADLAHDGDLSLFELLESRKKKIPADAVKSGNYMKEATELSMLCDRLQRIAMIEQKWLLKNDAVNDVNEDELEELGRLVDEALLTEHKFDNIMPALRGTRFAKGYQSAKQKVTSGFRFSRTAKNLATSIPRGRLVRQALIAKENVAEEKRSYKLSQEEKAVYEAATAKEKKLLDILLLSKPASSLIKKNEDDASKVILYLRKVMRQYEGGRPFIATIEFDGTSVRLEQLRSGIMKAHIAGGSITLPLNTRRFGDEIERDICDNIPKYGTDIINELFPVVQQNPLQIKKPINNDAARIRTNAIRILEKIMDKKAIYFKNVSESKLSDYVKQLVFAKKSRLQSLKDQITAEIAEMDSKVLYSDSEVIEQVLSSDDMMNHPKESTVDLPPEPKQIVVEDEPQWTEKEIKIKDFVADLVSNQSYWQMDKEYAAVKDGKIKGSRIKKLMMYHKEAVMMIMEDRSILDNTIDKMAFPGEEQDGEESDIKRTIKEDVSLIFKDEGIKEIQKLNEDYEPRLMIEKAFAALLKSKENDGTLDKIEKKIDADSKMIVDKMQVEFANAADNMFKPQENAQEQQQDFPDPYEKNIGAAEQQKRLELRRKEIERRIEKESTSDSGQGNFIKTVLKKYFGASSAEDQRAMVASMVRNAVVKKNLKDMNDDQKKAEKDRREGSTLSGFLKGCGPLLQKILQGIPEQGMSNGMKKALSDMKSSLAPIPDQVIRQRLETLIARSGGDVTDIRIERSLGAASVGQALLCRIFGPAYGDEGTEVVIKLLRPDAANRLVRDKKIIIDCANESDPGGSMALTYEGQVAKIEEEFDLTLEEKNLVEGEIYNKGDQSVKSAGRVKALAATGNVLVMEKAPGDTVDSFLREVEKKRGNITSRKELEDLLRSVEIRQKHLTVLANKWVTEGIYGSGFYHGDLHAGNILVDENGATIIDFGNSIQLSETQQLNITKLTAATAVGNAEDFVDAYYNLLEKTTKEQWQRLRPRFLDEVRGIFGVGSKELSGQMISLALLRASAIGLEVPTAINSFSQSQIRLQNTLEDINEKIYALRKDIEDLDKTDVPEPAVDLELMCRHEYISGNKDADETIKEYKEKLFPDMRSLLRQMRLTGTTDRNSFDAKWVNNLPEGEAKTALVTAIQELRTAQNAKSADLAAKEDAVAAAYERAFDEKRRSLPEYTKLKEKLSSTNAQDMEAVDKELAHWFSDKENFGEELSTLYEALRTAQNKNLSDEEQQKALDLFLRQYFEAASARFEAITEQKLYSRIRVRSFYGIMSDVTNAHLTASLNRLGVVKSLSYKKELDKRRTLKAPGQLNAAPVQDEAEKNRLKAVRFDVSKQKRETLSDTYISVQDKRSAMKNLEERTGAILTDYEKLKLENQLYSKNEKLALESDEQRKNRREITLSDAWKEVSDERIKAAPWLLAGEVMEGEQKPVYHAAFEELEKAITAELAKIDAKEDPIEKFEAEEKLHRLLVEMPRKHGGMAYFKGLMEGKDHKLPEEEGAESTIIAFFRAFQDKNLGKDKKAGEACAALLMLYGEKTEKSFLARKKVADKQIKDKNEDARRLENARRRRFRSVVGYIDYTLKEKKTMPDEYKGADGMSAYLAKIKANGWDYEKDVPLFEAVYKWVITPDNENDHPNPDKRAVIETYLSDIVDQKITCWDDRKIYVDILNNIVHDNSQAEGYTKVYYKLEDVRRGLSSRTQYHRFKSGNPELFRADRAGTPHELCEKARSLNWIEKDINAVHDLEHLLDNAYYEVDNGKTEEDKARAQEMADKLEPLVLIVDTQKLTSEQMKKDLFAKVLEIYGGANKLYNIERDLFDKAANKDWTEEDKKDFEDLKNKKPEDNNDDEEEDI